MDISINTKSTIPIYEQIIIQIQKGIVEKKISPNDGLPAIRQLADDLSLTANTVAKAYQIMEKDKVIITGGRRGTFIHPEALENVKTLMHSQSERLFQEFVNNRLNYGISKKDLKKIVMNFISNY